MLPSSTWYGGTNYQLPTYWMKEFRSWPSWDLLEQHCEVNCAENITQACQLDQLQVHDAVCL